MARRSMRQRRGHAVLGDVGGTVTALHNFAAATEGSQPNNLLAADAAGNIYGTTQTGGKYGGGTIWSSPPDTC